jgi:transposase-like protein
MFADKHPHAGGPQTYAAYLSNTDGHEVELTASNPVKLTHPQVLTIPPAEELKRLKREVAELRRANEILKAAAIFFGAELDRPRRR